MQITAENGLLRLNIYLLCDLGISFLGGYTVEMKARNFMQMWSQCS